PAKVAANDAHALFALARRPAGTRRAWPAAGSAALIPGLVEALAATALAIGLLARLPGVDLGLLGGDSARALRPCPWRHPNIVLASTWRLDRALFALALLAARLVAEFRLTPRPVAEVRL